MIGLILITIGLIIFLNPYNFFAENKSIIEKISILKNCASNYYYKLSIKFENFKM